MSLTPKTSTSRTVLYGVGDGIGVEIWKLRPTVPLAGGSLRSKDYACDGEAETIDMGRPCSLTGGYQDGYPPRYQYGAATVMVSTKREGVASAQKGRDVRTLQSGRSVLDTEMSFRPRNPATPCKHGGGQPGSSVVTGSKLPARVFVNPLVLTIRIKWLYVSVTYIVPSAGSANTRRGKLKRETTGLPSRYPCCGGMFFCPDNVST